MGQEQLSALRHQTAVLREPSGIAAAEAGEGGGRGAGGAGGAARREGGGGGGGGGGGSLVPQPLPLRFKPGSRSLKMEPRTCSD